MTRLAKIINRKWRGMAFSLFWAEKIPDSAGLSLEILKIYFPKQHSERILEEVKNLTLIN